MEKHSAKPLDLPATIDRESVLKFESNFECGNLDSAYYMSEAHYNLLMKVDFNTKGNSYWFMF